MLSAAYLEEWSETAQEVAELAFEDDWAYFASHPGELQRLRAPYSGELPPELWPEPVDDRVRARQMLIVELVAPDRRVLHPVLAISPHEAGA